MQFIKKILPYVDGQRAKIFGSVLFGLFLALLKAAQAYLVKPIFDQGLSDQSTFNDALILAGTLFGLLLLNFPFRFFHFYWIRFVVDKATCSVREDLYRKLQKLPMNYFVKNKQGDLLSKMLNDTIIFSVGIRAMIDLIREPLTAFFMIGLALYRDWQLALVFFGVAPLFVLIFNTSGKLIKRNQGNVQDAIAGMTHNLNEGINGQKITKSFNLQNFVLGRFRKSQDHFFDSQMKTTAIEEVAHPLVELVGGIAFSGIIIFAHHRITTSGMTTGDFISFITAMALVMDPIRKFSQANIKISQAKAAGERIFDLLDQPEEKDRGNVELSGFNNSIKIRNLSFSYGHGDVIKGLDLDVNKGEKVALVGLSGSGKSTLVNILLGLYPVDRGDIEIDGHPLEDIKLSSLRGLFGLVSQDVFLFNDTVRENLETGVEYSEQKVSEALKVAYADEFIGSLPEGLQTVIGDRGTRLSGGQQQRLTIARAFLKDTDILLFDEATSALDNESEKVVQKALDELAGNKTVIAVAHRLSTVQDFDKILVLKEGVMVEQGTHQQLMSNNGEYQKLYELSVKQ